MSHPKPDFLYIGVARAGSTWLYECLREHPDVYVPIAKDVEFFDNNYSKGIDWYLSFFKNGKGKKVIGELSHDYYLCPEVANRIFKLLPEIKLICCLREPKDKMLSHMQYAQRFHKRGFDFKSILQSNSFEKHSNSLSLHWDLGIHTTYYYNYLKEFYKYFPSENILVVFYDDLKENPALFLRKIYSFIQVDPDFMPGVLDNKINPTAKARIPQLTIFIYFIARILRQAGFANLVGSVKRNKIFKNLLFKGEKKKSNISSELIQKIESLCPKNYDKLSKLIGQNIPINW